MTTHEKLLQVGLEHFWLKGYHDTGIKDVLVQAGVPKGSFYHHFESKESFAKEVVALYMEGGMKQLEENLEDESLGTPSQRLRRHFQAMVDEVKARKGFERGCLVGNLSQELGDVSPGFAVVLSSCFAEMSEALLPTVRAAQEAGELPLKPSAEAWINFVLNSWQGALLRAKVSQSGQPLDDFMAFVFDESEGWDDFLLAG